MGKPSVLEKPFWLFATLTFLLFCGKNQLAAATCNWTGGTSNWNSPANWSCGSVPGAGDDVTISSGTVTVDVAAVVQTLMLNGSGNIVIDGDLTITGDASLTGTSASITGAGNLNIGGNLTWDEGSIGGSGTFTLAGTLTSTNGSTATLITRQLVLTMGGTLTNSSFNLKSGAILEVPLGQTLTIDNASAKSMDDGGGAQGTLLNNGTILKNGAGTFSFVSVIIDNNKDVTITAGKLDFGSASTSSHDNGVFSILIGTEATFSGLMNDFTNMGITGPGTFKVGTGGSVLWAGSTTVANPVDMIAGTLVVSAPQTIPSLVAGSSSPAIIQLLASLTVTGNATLNLFSSTPGITGSGNLTIGGNLLWAAGAIEGISAGFNLAGTLTSTNSTSCTLGRSLSLTSGGTFTDANLSFINSATLTIPANQTFTYSTATNRTISGTGIFTNYGTFVKSGAGVCTFSTIGNWFGSNGSTTSVQQGELKFTEIISNDNTATIKGVGTYTLSPAQNSAYGTFAPGLSPGTLTVNNYACEAGSTLDIEIVAGMPVLHDKLVVTGAVTIYGGTLKITETGNVAAGDYVILSATGGITGDFTTYDIPDCYEVDIMANEIVLKKGVSKIWDEPNSDWDIDASWDPPGVPCPNDDVTIVSGVCNLNTNPQMNTLTINGGELKKVVAMDTYSINAPTVIGPSGKLNIFAGTLEVNDDITNDGTIEGYGTIDVTAANFIGGFGKWAPGNSAGMLHVKGTHTNDIVEIEIGENNGAVELDYLDATQNLQIGGELDIKYLQGTVLPDTRTIMECFGGANCRTGTFANITYPPECGATGCNVIYELTRVRLQNTVPLEYTGPIVWLGGSGNFELATNWMPNEVPNGNDDVTIGAGTVTLNAPATVKSLNFSGGQIVGNFSLSVGHQFDWSGGQLSTIADNHVGPMALSGSPSLMGGSLFLDNGGTLATDAGLTISMGGTLQLSVGQTLTLSNQAATGIAQTGGGSSFINHGTLLKTGAGVFAIDVPYVSNGLTSIQAGTLKFNSTFNNTGGTVKGIASIDLTSASPIVTGFFDPGNSPGTLHLLGNYTNNATSQLDFEIFENGGNVTHDLLEITGDAALGGTLNVRFLGGNLPYSDYPILTTTGVTTGSFSAVNFFVNGQPGCPGSCNLAFTPTGPKLVFAALPIELVGFDGKLFGKTVELRWETASETNNRGFEIQRSMDGIDWENIGWIDGNGTTTEPHGYFFADKNPLDGAALYRLKITGNDGGAEFSAIVSVENGQRDGWQIFPNPTGDVLTVVFSKETEGTLRLFDWSGRPVLAQDFTGEKGEIDLSGLPPGVYWLRFGGGLCRAVVKK